MSYKNGISREQYCLFPQAFDDLLPGNHPVRVIDAFVDGLDLKKLGFGKAVPKGTGRPPYHPADLLKLYVYGYLNRVTSSRRLETESLRNLEVMWLLKQLAPDFKTIAEFRRQEGPALRQVCRGFVQFCQEAGVLRGEQIAVDGSKFGASNALAQNLSKGQMEKQVKRLDERIQAYLEELDRQDANEAPEVKLDASKTGELLKRLEEEKAQLTRRVTELEQENEQRQARQEKPLNQVSLTDPDARRWGEDS